MFCLTPNETLRLVVTFKKSKWSVNLRKFFAELHAPWWYIDSTGNYYLFERLWKVQPWSEEEVRRQPSLKGCNESLAEKQRKAWGEVYYRLMHYVAVDREWILTDKTELEELCRTVAETMLKRVPPSCYALPDLPYAQEFVTEEYWDSDLEDMGMSKEEIKAYRKDRAEMQRLYNKQ